MDLIGRQAAIELANSLKDDLPDDERIADTVMAHNEAILEYQTKLSLLPSAQPTCDTCKYRACEWDEDPCDGCTGTESKYEPERKRGKWLKAYGDHESFGVRPFYRYCSECNESTVWAYNYCPNCGSYNGGGDDE